MSLKLENAALCRLNFCNTISCRRDARGSRVSAGASPSQEKYVNDPAVLLEAAVAAGLDKDEAAAFIADQDAGIDEARALRFGSRSSRRLSPQMASH